MGAAIHRADVVGKTQQVVVVSISTPLKRHFYLNVVALTLHIHYLIVKRLLFTVHVGDIFSNAALIKIEFNVRFRGFQQVEAIIGKGNANSTIEERQFSQTTRHGCIIKRRLSGKNCVVRQKGNGGARAIARPRFNFQDANGNASLKPLGMSSLVAPNSHLQPFG